jgi:hypothetical protein
MQGFGSCFGYVGRDDEMFPARSRMKILGVQAFQDRVDAGTWLKPGAWGYRSEGRSQLKAPRFSPYHLGRIIMVRAYERQWLKPGAWRKRRSGV